MTADGSTWTMASGLYVNKEHQTRASLTATGTWLAKQRLLGNFNITYDPPSTGDPLYSTDAVDLIYSTLSEKPFDMAKAAGKYTGLWIPLEEVVMTITADGTITGLTARSCEFTGQAVANGPVAEGTVTFGGPPCQNGHATVRGVIGVDGDTLYAAGFSSDKNQGLLFIGRR